MIVNGTWVEWKDNNSITRGIVKDCYQFHSKKWADKYHCAYLIEQPNNVFVLKLESDLKPFESITQMPDTTTPLNH